MRPGYKSLNIYIPVEIHKQLRRVAFDNEVTVTEVVKSLIQKLLLELNNKE